MLNLPDRKIVQRIRKHGNSGLDYCQQDEREKNELFSFSFCNEKEIVNRKDLFVQLSRASVNSPRFIRFV